MESKFKVTTDPRVTKLSKYLRKTSLNKLPQLINIFNESISICGYTPVVKDELLSKYNSQEQELLLKTKPSLTGFWTSHGTSDVPYNERKKMELYYCYKRSFWLDVRIVWHTFFRLLKSGEAK